MITDVERNKIEKLIESIYPSQFKGLTTKIKYLYPDIYLKLFDIKNNLNLTSISESIYLVINNLKEPPKCNKLSPKCHIKLKFKNIIEGYYPYCKACSSKNQDFINNRYETNLERYGCKYPTQNKDVLYKIKTTVFNKYNVINVKQIKKD